MINAIRNNGLILVAFAVTSTLIVALTHSLTKDEIARQEAAMLETTLHQVLPDDAYNNELALDCVLVTAPEYLGTDEPQHVYRGYMNDQPVAAVLESVAPNGYSGKIHLLVSVLYDGSVSGVRVLKHKETPGLGDKVEVKKSNWILGFEGETLTEENSGHWAVKKDGGKFDQFTGATITPRSVVQSVKRTLDYFNKHKNDLFDQVNQCKNQP